MSFSLKVLLNFLFLSLFTLGFTQKVDLKKFEKKVEEECPLSYSLEKKLYKDDRVSVQTATNLALSAYLRGCTDRSRKNGDKKYADECIKRARRYVETDIISILDQN